MRAYLRLISLLLLFFQLPCLAQEEIVLTDSVVVDTVVTDTAEVRQYNLLLEAGPHQISGVCLMKMVSPTEVIGTVINEFGLTAFDFEYNGKKTKLSNLPPFLDKWYIRKVLQGDMSFFFSNLPNIYSNYRRMRLINDLFEVVSTKQGEDNYQCQVKFNPEHRIYKAHFPGNPITPGVCLMQIGEEILEEKNGKQLQLSVVKTIRFKKIIGPNDTPVYTFTKEVLDQDMLTVDITVSDEADEAVKMSLQYKVLDA